MRANYLFMLMKFFKINFKRYQTMLTRVILNI